MTTAENFDERIGITGLVLTRWTATGRAAVAALLDARDHRQADPAFVGLGEKMDALETFEPDRIAGRIPRHGRYRGPRRKGAGDAGGRTGPSA